MAAYSAAWALVPSPASTCCGTCLRDQCDIEASWAHVDKMRGNAEKLIDYGKLGNAKERALRMADFRLTEKHLIPKLVQVLAPRHRGQNGGYTRMLQIPNRNKQDRAKMAVMEYKGNCLPPCPCLAETAALHV